MKIFKLTCYQLSIHANKDAKNRGSCHRRDMIRILDALDVLFFCMKIFTIGYTHYTPGESPEQDHGFYCELKLLDRH